MASRSSISSLSSSRSSLQDTATSIPTPNHTSAAGTPPQKSSTNNYLNSSHLQQPAHPLSASLSTRPEQSLVSPALSTSSSSSNHSYRHIGGTSDLIIPPDDSSIITTSSAVPIPADSVSTLQRELHFAAEIGQYLLEQNQELEKALEDCRKEGSWLRSILAQVDKAAFSVVDSQDGSTTGRLMMGSASSSTRPVKAFRSKKSRSKMGSDGVDESVDGEDYGVPNVSLDQHHAQRHSKLSVTDLETSDDLAQKLYALREEHAVLQKESLIRQRLLQRSEAEADSLKREMEGLQIALMDLREENRVGALEYQRLRNAHMEDMERLKRMVTEPRKRFAEMEALVEVSEMEKREVGERLREAEGEVEELRRMLGDAREMIEKQGEGEIGTFVRSVMGRAMMCSVAVQTGPFDFVGTLEKGMARKVTFSLPGTPVEGEVGDEEKSLLMTFGGEAMDSVTRESGDGEDVKRISTASDVEPVVLQEAPLSPTSQLIGSRSVPNGDISTIVRLMVGAWLLKYNKRRSKAERRFVMVNPYTRTISWSKRDPSDEKNDGVSTVYIQSVHVEDLTDGRSRIVIIAPTREVVFECRSAAEHGIWERGLTLILQNHRGAIQRTTR